ncbi:Uncharacterised protein [Mycobacteroides abscessus subsp. abscessus]|nr:Uncharacterised protein [Mycobacteroides abscessus subsp. abscessus]
MPPKATAENTAAPQRLRATKYSPVIAGVSLIPAISPTSPPETHQPRVVRTGSSHTPTAVQATVAVRQPGSRNRSRPSSNSSEIRTTPYSAATVASSQPTAMTVKGRKCSGENTSAANGGYVKGSGKSGVFSA